MSTDSIDDAVEFVHAKIAAHRELMKKAAIAEAQAEQFAEAARDEMAQAEKLISTLLGGDHCVILKPL